jgi:HicB family
MRKLRGTPMASKTADAIKLVLRLPKPLHKRLKRQARLNNVSLNTEIVNQLEGHRSAVAQQAMETIAQALTGTAAKAAAEVATDVALQKTLETLERWAAERGMSIAQPPKKADKPE